MDVLVNKIIVGDAIKNLANIPDGFADLIITSPPYFGLRDYETGEDIPLGAEINPLDYVARLVDLFCGEIHRILKDTGSLYLNIGDKYYCSQMGLHRGNVKKYKRKIHAHYRKVPQLPARASNYRQNKQLLQLPTRVSAGMSDRNWVLRNELVWVKGHYRGKNNGTPNEAKDRFMPKSEEKIFLFTKKPTRYTYNKAEELRLRRGGFPGARTDGNILYCQRETYEDHEASFPERLIEPLMLISSNPMDMVIDPFVGSGTVAAVAKKNGRRYLGMDKSEEFCNIARKRLESIVLPAGKIYTMSIKERASSKNFHS